MAAYSPLDPAALRQRDEEHLRYLVIANYVYAAFHAIAVVSVIGVVLFLSGVFAFGELPIDPQELAIAGAISGVIAAVVIVIPLISTILQFLLARFLDLRRHHTYIFAVSILNCLSVPIGTVLGVLTLVVLMRPTVQQLFAEERARIDAAARAEAMQEQMD